MVMGTKRFKISTEWKGVRLDRFLRAVSPGLSFQAAQIITRKKRVLVNGDRTGGGYRLRQGDVVEVPGKILGEEDSRSKAKGSKGGPARAGGRQAGNSHSKGEEHGGPARSGRGAAGSDPGNGEGRGGSARSVARKTGSRIVEVQGRADSKAGPAAVKALIDEFGEVGSGIAVLFEDSQALVIDKPAGLVVQPGNRQEKGSLLDLLATYQRRTGKKKNDPVKKFPYTPVHRIDRLTSGALLVAKTRSASRKLSAAIRKRELEKYYLAVSKGVPEKDRGVIKKAIKTIKGESSRSVTGRGGREAVSEFTVLKELSGGRALLEISIKTGRTHQIRAHLASIGHPIAGDTRYGKRYGKGGGHSAAGGLGFGAKKHGRAGRLYLHSWRIVFPNPATGKRTEVAAPPPPEFGLGN